MGNDLGKELMKKKYKKKDIVDLRKQAIPEIPKSVRQLLCRELILAENDITSIPEEIGKLVNLEVLDLGNNRINHLPPAIGDLGGTLRELWLTNNKLFFSGPLTPNLGKLKNLVKLDLSGNQLEELPAEMGQMVLLQYLDISNNSLQVFPPEFGNMRALLIFKADNNRIRALPPEVGNLTALTEWSLGHNALTRLPPQIGNLQQLQVRFLSSPPKRTEGRLCSLLLLVGLHPIGSDARCPLPPNHQCSRLAPQVLDLTNNKIQDMPKEMGYLTKLRKLAVDENSHLKTMFPLRGLRELQILGMRNTLLDEIPGDLCLLPSLTELDLRNNLQFGRLPPELGRLTNLKKFVSVN